MDGLQDLRLGHFLTAADHLAVIGVLRDELCLLFRRALGKLDDALVVRVKVWVFLKLFALLHQADDVAGQRNAAGQARGFNAHEVDGIGCHVVPDLHLPVLNGAVLIHPLGLDTGEGADLILFKDVGPQLCALHGQTVHVGLRHAVIVQHIGVLGIRAHGDVAVHGGSDVDAHIGVAGHRVHRHGQQLAHALVENDIVAAGADDTVAGQAQQVGDLLCSQACGVDHPAGADIAVLGVQIVQLVFAGDGRDLVVKEEVHAVGVCVLGQSHRVQERVHDAAVFGPHGKLAHHGWHQLVQLCFIDHLKAGAAVDSALLHGALQLLHVLGGVAHQHLAATLEREVQLFGQLIHDLVTFHAALRFQAANGVGKAAVHHRRVAAAGLVADIQIFFQHCNAQFVARKFACNGAAHDTRTDDDHIVLFFHGIHLSPFSGMGNRRCVICFIASNI